MKKLDESGQFASVKRMEAAFPRRKFDWRKLKAASVNTGFLPIDVPDANYTTVKAYHESAWVLAYALEIPA
jgi:hypothetical protein